MNVMMRVASDLERQRHQIEHQPRVLVVIFGNAGGRLVHRREPSGVLLLGLLDAGFDIADRIHVFVHLLAVGGAQDAFQSLGVSQHGIEHALLVLFLAGAHHRVALDFAAAKKALEDGARTDFGRIRRRRRPPRDAVAVGAAIAVVAVAALDAFFAS